MLLCPICGGQLLPMLEEYSITARMAEKDSAVAGMAAFRCDFDGHVVFIRKNDLPARALRAAAAAK